MTTNVIDAATGDAATGEAPFAAPTGDERKLLLLLAVQNARDIRTRSQEDAAIDAEDILTQAEEANAFDPVG